VSCFELGDLIYTLCFLPLSWKKSIEYIVPRLSSACFAMRTVTPFMKIDTLKLVYFAYFYSIRSYGVFLWGNSTDSKIVFNIQKKIIRIIVISSVKKRISCG
jgi:hypothetical protein